MVALVPVEVKSVSDKEFVVEISGARGVGKSTLGAQLAVELSARGIECHRTRPPQEASRLAARLFSLVDEIRALWLFGRWRPESLGELRKLQRRYRRLRQTLPRDRSSGGVYIVDEGVWHLAMTVYIKTARKDMGPIAAILRQSLPFPDMVVLVEGSDASLATRRGRRDNRGDRRQPRLNEAGRRGLRQLTLLLEHQALQESRFRYLVVESDDPGGMEDSVPRVADAILGARAVHES